MHLNASVTAEELEATVFHRVSDIPGLDAPIGIGPLLLVAQPVVDRSHRIEERAQKEVEHLWVAECHPLPLPHLL
jgi:hypothetical protein